MILRFTILQKDRHRAAIEGAMRTSSGHPSYAAFTINPVAQALVRLGFTGVDAFTEAGYVVLAPHSPNIRRVVCPLTLDGSHGELTVPDHVLFDLLAERIEPTEEVQRYLPT